MRTRVIGLGNTLLTDDGVGVYVAREVARRLDGSERHKSVDVIESEVAGFGLMELIANWERVILVDSIQFNGMLPGSVIRLDPQDLHTSLRIRSVHEIDLPTVLELGRQIGLDMPRQITVFGIQAEDTSTFGECLTTAVARGLATATKMVLEDLGVPSSDTDQRSQFAPGCLSRDNQ